MKIVLLDDHELQVDGLKLILEQSKRFESVDTFNDSASLLAFDKLQEIDLFLVDLHLSDENGFEIIQQLRALNSHAKYVLLTMQRGSRHTIKAEKAKLDGYLLKNIHTNELIDSIFRIVNNNEVIYSKDSMEKNLAHDWEVGSSIHLDQNKVSVLTEREKEVLILVCQEYSSAEIAEKLFLSVGTVDTHRKNIINKLGVSNTVGLVKYALRQNLI